MIIDYKGINVLDPHPTGAGGDLLIADLKELADRAGPVHSAAADPTVNDDSAGTAGNGKFYVWSKWLNISNGGAFVCLSATPTAAVWVKGMSVLANDATPQLGGDLDMNAHNIQGVTPTEMGCLSCVNAPIQDQIGRTAKPAGMARIVSVRTLGTLSMNVKTTTGYAAARWWDGSVSVHGTGVPANSITMSKAVPASGNWSKSAPKEIFAWSCTSGNATQSGDLTYFHFSNNSLTSLDVSDLTALTHLYCQSNSLTSLDVSNLTALTNLYCYSNSLTSLRAVDVVLSYNYYSYRGSNISSNSLNAAALDQFYTDLGVDVGATGIIDVSTNPGTTGDDPSIATAKGYTIIGS